MFVKRNMLPYQLYKEPCETAMYNIKPGSVDMVLCDLPYGVTNNKSDIVIPFSVLWEHYNRIVKPNGAILLFGQGIFYVDLVDSNRKDYRYDYVWDKVLVSGFLNANRMPMKSHEQIAVFYKKPPVYYPQKTPGRVNHSEGSKKARANGNYGEYDFLESDKSGMKHPTTILTYSKSHPSKSFHRNEKPVPLLEMLIRTYTNEGDLVLDNCMGSGSTGVAALKCFRRFIGIEKEDEPYSTAVKRIKEVCP